MSEFSNFKLMVFGVIFIVKYVLNAFIISFKILL